MALLRPLTISTKPSSSSAALALWSFLLADFSLVARLTISMKPTASLYVPACGSTLADYYLAVGNLEEAERLINETGYHRRDREIADLRARLLA